MLRNLPDNVRNAESPAVAALRLAAALRESGELDVQVWSPEHDREQTGQGVYRVVIEGSADPDWGVALSLHDSALRCGWGHLEPHWGFDVGFVPREG